MNKQKQQLDSLISEASDRIGTGILLGVKAPLIELDWRGSPGPFERGSDAKLSVDDGFRIASMSKVFTAVLVLQEVEAGRLALTDGLKRFFDAKTISQVHPQAERITLAHLLNHTAGLWDFALSASWFKEISIDPGRFRPPEEILAWAIEHGEPVGDVGHGHVYSDLGFVLLGRILELHCGESYQSLCQERIFTPLGMASTWLEGHEDPRSTLSHCYGEDFDALMINGSADWAAGGHVSTLTDLDQFLRGLFHRGALLEPKTLDRMLVSVKTPNHLYGQGLGIRVEKNPESGSTYRFWGHSGHWGSFMFYVPALRATICGTVNKSEQDNRWIFERILSVIG